MLVTKQLMDAIDFYTLWKSMGSIDCLVTDILPLCSAEERDLKQLEGE